MFSRSKTLAALWDVGVVIWRKVSVAPNIGQQEIRHQSQQAEDLSPLESNHVQAYLWIAWWYLMFVRHALQPIWAHSKQNTYLSRTQRMKSSHLSDVWADGFRRRLPLARYVSRGNVARLFWRWVSTQNCSLIIGPYKRAKAAAITSSPNSSFSSNRLKSTNPLDALCLDKIIQLGLKDLVRLRRVRVLNIATDGSSLLQSDLVRDGGPIGYRRV